MAMELPKAEIFSALAALGYECRQGSQAVFANPPAITFYVANNSVDLDLDNEISSQEVTVVVDIFADDSPTASRILSEVEIAMRNLGYRLSFSADVPSPEGALYHITTRFDGVL